MEIVSCINYVAILEEGNKTETMGVNRIFMIQQLKEACSFSTWYKCFKTNYSMSILFSLSMSPSNSFAWDILNKMKLSYFKILIPVLHSIKCSVSGIFHQEIIANYSIAHTLGASYMHVTYARMSRMCVHAQHTRMRTSLMRSSTSPALCCIPHPPDT